MVDFGDFREWDLQAGRGAELEFGFPWMRLEGGGVRSLWRNEAEGGAPAFLGFEWDYYSEDSVGAAAVGFGFEPAGFLLFAGEEQSLLPLLSPVGHWRWMNRRKPKSCVVAASLTIIVYLQCSGSR